MKTPSFFFLLLFAALFNKNSTAQKVDCQIYSNVYSAKDNTVSLLVHLKGGNDPFIYTTVSSIIDTISGDTLSLPGADFLFGHALDSVAFYTVPVKENWLSVPYKKVNMQYKDSMGQQGEVTCPIYSIHIDTTFCKRIQLLNDTVEVDVAKDETDLKFTISGEFHPYPNYLFESFDDRLIIEEPFAQTYVFFGDSCIGEDCAEFTPFHYGVDFKSSVSQATYVQGRFSIGYLHGNTCPFDVVYHVSPAKSLSLESSAKSLSLELMNESNFSVFPNPVVDVLRVSEASNSFYFLFNVHGDEIQNGVVGDSINLEQVPAGIYFLKINNKINKIVKQ
jgi:hypothetical protein